MTFFGFFLLEFFGVVVETGVFLMRFAVAEAGYAVAHCCCVGIVYVVRVDGDSSLNV